MIWIEVPESGLGSHVSEAWGVLRCHHNEATLSFIAIFKCSAQARMARAGQPGQELGSHVT